MRRTEIWTAAAGSGYVGKPRPVVIIQDDRFDATDSVTVCAFTTDPVEAPLIRLQIEPDDVNGLVAATSSIDLKSGRSPDRRRFRPHEKPQVVYGFDSAGAQLACNNETPDSARSGPCN